MTRNRAMVAPIFVMVVLSACSAKQTPAATHTTQPVTGPISPGGTSGGTAIGSCIEPYTPTNLAKRHWAFDGTVKSSSKATTETGADSVTFTVNRWYKGGTSSEVTRTTYGLGGVTSAGTVSGKAGERMLVTGDDDNMWTCGFTQTYSETAAREWSTAFGS